MRISICIIIIATMLLSCNSSKENEKIAEMIIPRPSHIEAYKGRFEYSSPGIYISGISGHEADVMLQVIRENLYPNAHIVYNEDKEGVVRIKNTPSLNLPEEGYELEVTDENITINGNGYKGMFYGLVTVAQLYGAAGDFVPALKIKDEPRFKYRGFMLDVSRNFFGVEYIKKLLKGMAYYKLNTFHWHLTDGSGWRVEIKKYPKLTEMSAWRPYNDYFDWDRNGRKFCNKQDEDAHGGYYTQTEIKEVVAYAKALNITIIPDISMPANSEAVIAAYPELGCLFAGDKKGFCPSNENSFVFIENVLSEIMALFPSEYIFIGGGGMDLIGFEKCANCKKNIKKKGLKGVVGMNRYFINNVEAFLKRNLRKVMVWDEALRRDGSFSSAATIMALGEGEYNYRACKKGYNSILAPANLGFLSSYQGDPASEPEAEGGYISLESIYNFNILPEYLSAEEKNRIPGIEALLWTEYISDEKYADYMIFPRLLAVSENAWSYPENKSWDRFIRAVNNHKGSMKRLGINTCPISNRITKKEYVNYEKNNIELSLKCDISPSQIRYTVDGSDPDITSTLFKTPIIVKDSITLKTAVFVEEVKVSDTQTFKSYYHKGIGKKVIYNSQYSLYYSAGNETALTDGYTGSFAYNDGKWQAFTGDVDVIIDFGEKTSIKNISAKFMQQVNSWILFPKWVEIYTSNDIRDFKLLKRIEGKNLLESKKMAYRQYGCECDLSARYVRYIAHREKDSRTYMFVDELIVK
ncbi:MAG: family 20 glycosylhydrolase [Bacteroidales bacterium]